jgi:hypothetical protein
MQAKAVPVRGIAALFEFSANYHNLVVIPAANTSNMIAESVKPGNRATVIYTACCCWSKHWSCINDG